MVPALPDRLDRSCPHGAPDHCATPYGAQKGGTVVMTASANIIVRRGFVARTTVPRLRRGGTVVWHSGPSAVYDTQIAQVAQRGYPFGKRGTPSPNRLPPWRTP